MATNSTQVAVTADDEGPILAIAAWFMMSVMILAVLAKVTIKIAIRRQLNLEDYTVTAAVVLGIGQTIAISLGIQYGLGKREANLSPENVMQVQQAQYAAEILYILTVGLAKVSILQLLWELAVSTMHKRMANITIYVVLAWTASSFFALAFQCGLAKPWAAPPAGQCIDKFTFWVAIAPVDILTELVVALLPVFMIVPVKVVLRKKFVVVMAFIFRVAVIAVTIVRLYLLRGYYSSGDLIFYSVASGVASQALLGISVTTACIPALKPFLDGFDSGMLGVSFKQKQKGPGFSGNSYEMRSVSSGNRFKLGPPNAAAAEGGGYMAAISGQRSQQRQNDTESVGSEQSDAMIIKRTDQWDIRYERAHTHPSSLEPQKDVEDHL